HSGRLTTATHTHVLANGSHNALTILPLAGLCQAGVFFTVVFGPTEFLELGGESRFSANLLSYLGYFAPYDHRCAAQNRQSSRFPEPGRGAHGDGASPFWRRI